MFYVACNTIIDNSHNHEVVTFHRRISKASGRKHLNKSVRFAHSTKEYTLYVCVSYYDTRVCLRVPFAGPKLTSHTGKCTFITTERIFTME